jgi:hypothetical protein
MEGYLFLWATGNDIHRRGHQAALDSLRLLLQIEGFDAQAFAAGGSFLARARPSTATA